MIRLAANLSDALLELMRSDEAAIDGVEVGPWFSVRQIRDYREALPGIPFYFHGADLIGRVSLIPGTLSKVASYRDCTASPWVSVHMTMWLPGMVWLMLRHGLVDAAAWLANPTAQSRKSHATTHPTSDATRSRHPGASDSREHGAAAARRI